VVQETFLRLVKTPRAQVETHVAPWLYTVCRNRAADINRRNGRQPAPTRAEAPDVEALAEHSESVRQALAAIASLPPRQQELLRLRFQGGLSYKEIAEVTGLSATNVGYLLHTALQQVREDLQPVAPGSRPEGIHER
jgi:RNA polymerase sigma-70 factor (ECF subfamily)